MTTTTPTKPASEQGAVALFRKKPVVIEAVQIEGRFVWPDWLHDAVTENRVIAHGCGKYAGESRYMEIRTLEGIMRADEGDWIIRGVKGELYPCKPDIFATIYEPAAAAAPEPAASPPSSGEVRAVDEMGRDDLRRRAKQLLKKNGWKPADQFSAHSTVELMVALAIDAVRTPPDRCAYPECGCCHDATCGDAPLASDATANSKDEPVAWRYRLFRETDKWTYETRKREVDCRRTANYEIEALYANSNAADEDVRGALAKAVAEEREACAQIAYRVCAETRHVTLGYKAADAIRARTLATPETENNDDD